MLPPKLPLPPKYRIVDQEVHEVDLADKGDHRGDQSGNDVDSPGWFR